MGKKDKKKNRAKQFEQPVAKATNELLVDYVIDDDRDYQIICWVALTTGLPVQAYDFYRLYRMLWVAYWDSRGADCDLRCILAAVTQNDLLNIVYSTDKSQSLQDTVQLVMGRVTAYQEAIHQSMNDFPELLNDDWVDPDDGLDGTGLFGSDAEQESVAPSLVVMSRNNER